MIEAFPVGDSLHLIDLGIMKRCLTRWRDGGFGCYAVKWCAKDISIVSEFLLRSRMPSEIHRAVRALDCLAHWKGSEYRTFLHYLGIVILKDVLSCDAYYHFLQFFCCITICSSKMYTKFLSLAKELLSHYVEHYRDYYGEDYITSNVHNLTHLVDEVKNVGPLPTFNAYPFENKLYQLKNLLRNGNNPLSQVAKRLTEIMQVELDTGVDEGKHFPKIVNKRKYNGVFSKIEFIDFSLSTLEKDKWFLTLNNEIVEMHEVVHQNDKIVINGRKLQNIYNVFELPIKSSYLNIYKSNCMEKISGAYTVSDIKCKLVAVPSNNEIVFIPLLHTM